MAPHPDGLLSTTEVAALTGRSFTTISCWTRRGELPYAECRNSYGRRAYFYRPLDVVRVMIEKEEKCAAMNWKPRDNETETMEDLERLIAERSKPENLPSWWWKDWERMATMPVGKLLKGEDDDSE